MTNSLEGKVALVTGAGRGQGRSHALHLARAGASVVCLDTESNAPTIEYPLATKDDLMTTVGLIEKEDRRAVAVVGDVRSQADLDRAVATAIDELGGLDIVVANAGVWGLRPFWEISEEEWSEMIDIVLSGIWRTVKAATPHLIEQQSGSVIVISSINGLEGGPEFAHYTAAKHGVIGLMRSMAQELGSHNVRVNAVCPGIMDTNMNDWQGSYDLMAGRKGGTPEDRRRAAYNWNLLKGRGLLPVKATSEAVVWLASDATEHVTGVALPVDAGHIVLPSFNNSPVIDG